MIRYISQLTSIRIMLIKRPPIVIIFEILIFIQYLIHKHLKMYSFNASIMIRFILY